MVRAAETRTKGLFNSFLAHHAKRVIRLLGGKIGEVKSVMFGIRNLIFYCKYLFLKMFLLGIDYQRYLLSRRLGVIATTARQHHRLPSAKRNPNSGIGFGFLLFV